MEETPVQAFTVGDPIKNSESNASGKDVADNDVNDRLVDVEENEDGPTSQGAAQIEHENVAEISDEPVPNDPASLNSSAETQNRADTSRNTPPPVYVGENESENITGNAENNTVIVEKSKNEEIVATPENFWLVGNYKKVVKKIEDGSKLCEELSQMMSERAEIESLYAKKLKGRYRITSECYSIT